MGNPRPLFVSFFSNTNFTLKTVDDIRDSNSDRRRRRRARWPLDHHHGSWVGVAATSLYWTLNVFRFMVLIMWCSHRLSYILWPWPSHFVLLRLVQTCINRSKIENPLTGRILCFKSQPPYCVLRSPCKWSKNVVRDRLKTISPSGQTFKTRQKWHLRQVRECFVSSRFF